ncbi:hypothetical protein AB0E67_10405 [Streptomyces sp. NPDC032161]|uniref:hypothetical protein n=1 Tax=unclassified Streptomyces TaxID=2593676 RepID=UPI0033C926A5
MPKTPLSKVIAVLRAPSADRYRPVVDELVAGGVREIELTLTTPGALDVVGRLRADIGEVARIGVGTVTDGVQARAALVELRGGAGAGGVQGGDGRGGVVLGEGRAWSRPSG